MNTCEKAIVILQKTKDGEALAPEHLWLVQEAVNGHLTEEGMDAFEELYLSVESGYKRPWFYGIEHLHKNHYGGVFWKGIPVEEFHFGKNYEGEKKYAQEVAQRCRYLEEHGQEVTNKAIAWDEWRIEKEVE